MSTTTNPTDPGGRTVGHDARPGDRPTGFARLTAWVAIISTVLVVIVNFVLGDAMAPALEDDHTTLVDWITDDRPLRVAAPAVRYLALAGVPIIAVGVAAWVGAGHDHGQRPWADVGRAALVWLAAIGTSANTLQAIAVAEADALRAQPELARLLWLAVTALFTIALIAWGVALAAFSEAGRRTGTLPLWVCRLGLVVGASGIATTVTVVPVLDGEAWAHAPAIIAFFGVLLWLPAVGVHMLRTIGAGERRR